MMYDILLLNVYRDTSGYSECFHDCIGQYLLAAYLRKHDFVAQVYAGTAEDCKKVLEKEVGGGHVRIVGFYAAADNIRVVSHAVKWVKENFDAVTIVGGPQAVALKPQFFLETSNDFAIVGEGELPMLHLISYLVDGIGTREQLPSVKYIDKEKNALVWNRCDQAVIADLDTIPFPHVVDSLTRRLRSGKMAGILTGRGCPNHCTFCYEGANAKNVRFRSIPNVMEEIDYIREHNPGIEYLNVYDDTFTLQPGRVLEFCREMKARGLKWFCEGYVSFVIQHPEILQEMVDSGLTCIQFGIESGSNQVLAAYNKRTTREMILQCIQICKESGIHGITGNFIIGGAKETAETLEESRKLAADMLKAARGILELYTVYFAPYPNTRMSSSPQEFGIEMDQELLNYNLNTMRSPVVRTEALTAKEIYGKKHEFDRFLEECYRQEALASKKADVIQGMYQDGRRIHVNPTWEAAYLSFHYIDVFLRHMSEEEQQFRPDAYPIRTFDDFVLDGGKMTAEPGAFEGLEKEILLRASGQKTAAELSRVLGVTIDEMEAVFYRLNNRCLLYMSRW